MSRFGRKLQRVNPLLNLPVVGNIFTTQGWHLKDPDGNEFVPIGANVNGVEWVWNGPTIGQSAVAQNTWSWSAIRLNCSMPPPWGPSEGGGGYAWNTNDNINGIISEYTARKIAVMVAQHYHTAGTLPDRTAGSATDGSGRSVEQGMTDWWVSLATQHKNNPYVWFNLFNEPGDGLSSHTEVNQLYRRVIPAIRAVAPKSVIVLDAGSFGQDIPGEATLGSGTVKTNESMVLTYGPQLLHDFGPASGYGPIVFSIHTYSRWGWNQSGGSLTQAQMNTRLRDYIQRVHNLNMPLVVGEVGIESFFADVDTLATTAVLNQGGDTSGVAVGFTGTNNEFHRVGALSWHGDNGAPGMGVGNNRNWSDVTSRTTARSGPGQWLWDYAHLVN